MPPPSHAKEIVIVQELGTGPSSSEGSRKRRKSIVSASPPPKVNGIAATGTEINAHATTHGSPKVRKANGIGSRGMLVVGK